MKVEQKKIKTSSDHARHAFYALWDLVQKPMTFDSKEDRYRTCSYAMRYHQAGWAAGIKAILMSPLGLSEAQTRQDAAHRLYWASEKKAYPEESDQAWAKSVCDSWFLFGFSHAIDYIMNMRKEEAEKDKQPQFVKELKELLRKWDAEIWADKNEEGHLRIFYAGHLSNGGRIEGGLAQFVNGDDS